MLCNFLFLFLFISIIVIIPALVVDFGCVMNHLYSTVFPQGQPKRKNKTLEAAKQRPKADKRDFFSGIWELLRIYQ